MKKFLIFSILIFCQILSGQILCIKCYDQNEPFGTGINNLIRNGGFENGCPVLGFFCPTSEGYSCDLDNWKCTGGGTKTYCSIHSINWVVKPVEGIMTAYLGNQQCRICSDTPYDISCLSLNGCTIKDLSIGYPINEPDYGGPIGVSLEQTIDNLIPNNIYILEFWAGGEVYDKNFNKIGIFALDVGFGKDFLIIKGTSQKNGNIGKRYLVVFKANFSSHTIKFTNWGHICLDCPEVVLDDVRLYTLAELSPSVNPCVTETNDPNENVSVSLHPNPFINELIIESENLHQMELILYDITSRKILQQMFQKSVVNNTELLENGIYFYEVRSKSGLLKTGKVVKN